MSITTLNKQTIIPEIQIQMQQVQELFHQNIDLLIKNNQSIPSLYTKTQDLTNHTRIFKKSSINLKNKSRWRVSRSFIHSNNNYNQKHLKMSVILIVILSSVMIVVIVSIVFLVQSGKISISSTQS